MNKEAFLLALYDEIRSLPIDDVERSVNYYRELIDDAMDDGMSEEEAVASLGGVREVAEQILSDIPLTSLVRAKVAPERRPRAWVIVLLVLGSPLWLPLLIALFVVLLSVYVVIWSLVLALYAVTLSLGAGAVALIAAAAARLLHGGAAQLFLTLGMGLVCGGGAVLLLLGSNRAAALMARLSRRAALWVKSLFVRKEGRA